MLHAFVYAWLGLDDLMDQADDLHVRQGSDSYKAAALYIKALNQLRSFPHHGTQTMMEALCEIVHHNLVFISLAEPASMLEIQVTNVIDTFHQAAIRVPVNWLELFQEDPICQLGGVLYTGSQAVDFYNGKLASDPMRSCFLAQAHEAELLKLAAREFPRYQLDLYQEEILDRFPRGLDSPGAKELLYPLAPVDAIEA